MPMHSERYPYNHQENGDYPHEENHGYENYEEHEREDASGYTRQYNTYEGDHYPEEHSYDYDYDHEQGFDDQNHDDESHYQHDQAEYFNEANGFVIAGGTFSSVAGSVYHDGYTYSAHSHPSAYASHPQRPPIGQHRTSFFKRASNFRIEDGDFLSVGGDVHGLRQPSRPRPPQRAPEPVPHGPRMGMGAPRGRGAYDGYSYGPQPSMSILSLGV
ncbi:hypothetical protein BDZ97DRAFT_65201 [Flammula alnicola]|nr:hypothetical protein BDZ97DRAFT_65201 [Flammula alnicola]